MKGKKRLLITAFLLASAAAGTIVGIGVWQGVQAYGLGKVADYDPNNGLPTPQLTQGVPELTYGGLKENTAALKDYAYKLEAKYQAQEQERYTEAAVAGQVTKALQGLNSPWLNVGTSFATAVYNFVQAFNENNAGGVVAWRTSQTHNYPENEEYATIYLEGGPLSGPKVDTFNTLQRIPYWRGFYLNEAQFDLVPADLVKKGGATAATNAYFMKLRSSDAALLAGYKSAYDRGILGDGAYFPAIGGDLDLNWTQLRAAAALATGIVASARTTALTNQLAANKYTRIAVAGLSYGMPLGLLTLLLNPALTNALYAATFGENAISEPTLPARYSSKDNRFTSTRIDYGMTWDRNFFSLRTVIDMRPWVDRLLEGQYGDSFRQKVIIHNARDDEKFLTQWSDEQIYWLSRKVSYKLYSSGGHSVWLYDRPGQAALSGSDEYDAPYNAGQTVGNTGAEEWWNQYPYERAF